MNIHCKTSLRHKVGKIIAIFSTIIIIFYTGVMAFLLEWGLANGAGSIIWQESRLFLKEYKENPDAPLAKGRSVNGYIGAESLPPHLQNIFSEKIKFLNPDTMRDRWYLLTDNSTELVHHNILISKIPEEDRHLFVHYQLIIPKNVEFHIWDTMYYTAIIGGVLVIFMLLIFRKVLQRSLNPLQSLSKWIDRIEENNALEELPKDIPENEIGQVASSLFYALERINISNEREKQFLRNASHELRTPIAIIRNTMDVIEHKKKTGDDKIDHLLERVRRASDTMKAVTEAILWLAIENYSPPSQSNTNLKKLIEDLVEENKALLQDRSVNLNMDIDGLDSLEVEHSLIYIVYDNLIRNAFQHASHGEISITSSGKHSLEIANNRQDLEEIDDQRAMKKLSTGNFGLGLALVNKISEKMGWSFSFNIENSIARAKIQI